MTSSGFGRHAAPTDFDLGTVLDRLEVALQPIIEVATGAPFAYEALARFGHAPGVAADDVIAEAHASGVGYLLEAECLRAALRRRAELPSGVAMAVNVSPDVLQVVVSPHTHVEVVTARGSPVRDFAVSVACRGAPPTSR